MCLSGVLDAWAVSVLGGEGIAQIAPSYLEWAGWCSSLFLLHLFTIFLFLRVLHDFAWFFLLPLDVFGRAKPASQVRNQGERRSTRHTSNHWKPSTLDVYHHLILPNRWFFHLNFPAFLDTEKGHVCGRKETQSSLRSSVWLLGGWWLVRPTDGTPTSTHQRCTSSLAALPYKAVQFEGEPLGETQHIKFPTYTKTLTAKTMRRGS